MIDMRYKPPHLPQISAPYSVVIDELNNMGVDYVLNKFDPHQLAPSQGFSFCDDFKTNDSPIWVAGENDETNTIIDGHHRWVNCLSSDESINGVKLMMKPQDASRILNKIQDIYEYKQQQELEEVHTQNINDKNDKGNYNDDWLMDFEKNNNVFENDGEEKTKNEKKIVGYRDKPVNENSVIGNFFSLIPVNGYEKYEVDFENLLDVNDLGVQFYSGQNPTEVLAKIWFPNINFENLSTKYGTSPTNLKNRCVAEKAKRSGYDGIKYGDVLIQAIT